MQSVIMNSSACVETDFQDSKLRDQTLGGKLAGEKGAMGKMLP